MMLLPIALLLGACVKPKQYGGMMEIDQAGVAHRLHVLCLLGVGPSVADESCAPETEGTAAARPEEPAPDGSGATAATSRTAEPMAAGPSQPPAPEPSEAQPTPERGTAAVHPRE